MPPETTASIGAPTFEAARDRLMSERPDLFAINSRFAPKLTFADRCAVLLFHKLGISTPILAVAFHLNRGTVRYITGSQSRHYKNVRQEWAMLGPDAFFKKYWTEDWQQAIQKAKDHPDATTPEDTLKERTGRKPSARSDQKAGEHKVFMPQNGLTKTVVVAWRSEPHLDQVSNANCPPGWYLSLATPEEGWPLIFGDPEHSASSTAALKGFLDTVQGEIQ